MAAYIDVKFTCTQSRFKYHYTLPLGQFELRHIVEPATNWGEGEAKTRHQVCIYSQKNPNHSATVYEVSSQDWNQIRRQIYIKV